MRSGFNQSTLKMHRVFAEQSAKAVVMVSPDYFQFNPETAETNAFQHEETAPVTSVARQALNEFNAMVELLRAHRIQVFVLPSRVDVPTPDAVFPNNWFSTHVAPDGHEVLVLYPMLAKNRRDERQVVALQALLDSHHITIDETVDLTTLEQQQCFLEGTGSMVLDHVNKIAYAALSPRTDSAAVKLFCEKMGYKPVTFNSYDASGKPIYHTNVVMSVGSQFAVLAVDTIVDEEERKNVLSMLEQTNKQLISITRSQMAKMAGNILEVRSSEGKRHVIMSQTAFDAFTPEQRETIAAFGEPIKVQIDIIEKLGGGSARCMLAEIFYREPVASEQVDSSPMVAHKTSL